MGRLAQLRRWVPKAFLARVLFYLGPVLHVHKYCKSRMESKSVIPKSTEGEGLLSNHKDKDPVEK